MFMGFCVLLLLASVPLLGGDLRLLATVRLRLTWLVFAALATQVLVISFMPRGSRTFEAVVHVLTYVAAAVVVVVNRRVPGLLLIGAGTLSNGTVITLNGGTLPASPAAQAAAHLHKLGRGLDNSAPLAHPRLGWLGDNFVSPSWLPFHNVVSIGDLLILAGAATLMWSVTGVGDRLRSRRSTSAGH